MACPKIYLAGPEVFLPDAITVLAEKAVLARQHGFDPLTPFDKEVEEMSDRHAMGMAIWRNNRALMDECDLMIANVTPFRGVSADVGTAFEMGYMAGRGARVSAYSNMAQDHFARLCAHYRKADWDRAGNWRGPDGMAMESFCMFDNLMLEGIVRDSEGVFTCRDILDPARLFRDLEAFDECLMRLRLLVN